MREGGRPKSPAVEQEHGEETPDDAAGMGNGHRVAHETKVQEGEEHPATERFHGRFADDQEETNLADAALGRTGRLSRHQLQSGDSHQAVGNAGESAQAAR